MRARIKGDVKILEAWRKALEGAPKLLGAMSKNMAEETVTLIADTFREQRDPFGVPWAEKQRDDGRAILTGRTSRLRNGWHVVRTSGGGFTIAPSVDYAGFHQGGTRHMVRRAMIPYGGRLPPAWSEAYRETAVETLERHFASTGNAAGRGFVASKLIGLKRSTSPLALIKKAFRAVQGE